MEGCHSPYVYEGEHERVEPISQTAEYFFLRNLIVNALQKYYQAQ